MALGLLGELRSVESDGWEGQKGHLHKSGARAQFGTKAFSQFIAFCWAVVLARVRQSEESGDMWLR